MSFSLPALPYATDALEPYIDEPTMEIHHGKHHAAYVAKLNVALKDLGSKSSDISEILLDKKMTSNAAVRNNGGGHYNHTHFWEIMTPGGSDKPTGGVEEEIRSEFGSVDEFKKKFGEAAATRFGSGWAWLIVTNDNTLEIMSSPNQDNPIITGEGTPILGLDVWEHAYYLNYQNRRPDYINAFWNVVNWDVVNQNYEGCK